MTTTTSIPDFVRPYPHEVPGARSFLCVTTTPQSTSYRIVWHTDPAVIAAYYLNDESLPHLPAEIEATENAATAKRGDVCVIVRVTPRDFGVLDDDQHLANAQATVDQYCVRLVRESSGGWKRQKPQAAA